MSRPASVQLRLSSLAMLHVDGLPRRVTTYVRSNVRSHVRSHALIVGALLLCGSMGTAPMVKAQGATVKPASGGATIGASTGASRNTANGDLSSWSKGQCIAGLSYGTPLKLAASYGGGLRYEPMHGGADVDLCTFGVAKIGLGGARVAIGQGASFGSLGSGVMVSGGLLRTFGAPSSATPKRNYAGVSVHLMPLLAFGVEIGWYSRLGDGANEATDARHVDQKQLVFWSVGFGY